MTFEETIQNVMKTFEPFEVRDVIELLQEQNTKLKAVIKEKNEVIDSQKAEIERLKIENRCFADIGRMYSEIKAEAVREFAEVVVCDIDNYCEKNIKTKPFVDGVTGMQIAHNLVYKRLKEMVGES